MRRLLLSLLLATFAIPLSVQQEAKLVIPLTPPGGELAPNIEVGSLSTASNDQPLNSGKIRLRAPGQ